MRAFRWVYVLFFLSGIPALLYQIVWQRALFSIYGVNIESVTMVVSAFMLGLGLGSLAGGWLSERPGVPLLAVFGAVELGIAAFGVCSLPLFHRVAEFTTGEPALQTGLITFGLVVIPTVLMGATLPLLVAHLVRLSGNVGRSVGTLYFVNTLGSAAACFAAAFYTMPRLGMSGSTVLAAGLNTAIGSTVLALHFRRRGGARPPAPPAAAAAADGLLPLRAGMLLSAAAGFLSLGYEILWYRVYSFISGSTARGFACVLGAFLAGIAFGSLGSRRLCRARTQPRAVALVVLLANLAGFATIPLIAAAVRRVDYGWALPLIALAAALLGATFPLVCHLSVRPDARAGAGTSYLYLANILGSTAGSLVVGFLLMDVWPLRSIALFLAAAGIGVAALLHPAHLRAAAAAAVLIAAAGAVTPALFHEIYEKLQYQRDYVPGRAFTDIVETRSGVITVDAEGTVYGGGHYDGMLVTSLTVNDAPLRPYAISFFHPAPRRVLIIGMASGAWAEVVANHPQVERVEIVEINPGYLTVMRRHAEVAPLLSNPKAAIYIDDGRRWMARHPERRYDLILMDTVSHWRAHATSLLSREFLLLARRHLAPGGVLYYNTSHSPEAQRTALEIFPHLFRFGRFLACAESPLAIDRGRWRRTLETYRIEGRPVFDPTDADDRARLEEVLAWADTLAVPAYDEWGMEDMASIRRRVAGGRIVTDDNMACEWKQ